MGLKYYKRHRMECDLRRRSLPLVLAPGYRLIAWQPGLVNEHAETKYDCFRGEVDARIFSCLGERDGCQKLMDEIVHKPGFLPEATWLMQYVGVPHKPEFCGTIQGIRATPRFGAIQNVGVVAEHRGRGIGRALVAAALLGFQQAGLRRAVLEVTAENDSAVRLYQRVGFRRVKTLYKAVELAYSAAGR